MRVLYITFALVLVDQLSKLYIKGFNLFGIVHKGMYEGERIPVIGDFFRITFIENPGMAFGYDPGSGLKFWLSLFSLVASIAILVYLYIVRHKSLSLRLALAFILGGAIGNLIDRVFYGVFYGYAPLFYGYVVDFLDVDFFNFSIFGRTYDRWPIFNIADAAVSIGVLILLFFYKQYNTEDNPETAVVTEGETAAIQTNDDKSVTEENNNEIKKDNEA